MTGRTYTGSAEYLAFLETSGSTIEAELASIGIVIADANNVTLAEIGLDETNATEFTIYRVETRADGTMELRTGATTGALDSSTPELRPTRLSSVRRFDKVE